MKTTIEAPIARQIPKELEIHNDIRTDNYFWLNQRENQNVLDYLNAENEFYLKETSHTKAFETQLFEEMKARIKEDDASVPYKYNGYWYIVRYEKGKDYPIYIRKKECLDAEEELLFDCNEMAKGHGYFRLVGLSVSPDNTMITFGVDTSGRRQYNLQIKSLITNEIFSDIIENTTGSSTWANDNCTIFYTKKDEQTLRANEIFKHKIGDSEDNDVIVFTEDDDTFGVTVYKSKSKKYIIIACYSTLTNEFHVLNADMPDKDFKVFQHRIRGLEYSISHYEDQFYVVTTKMKQ